MKLYIKNMVCIRCKMVVKAELEKLGAINPLVDIGQAEISDDFTPEQLRQFHSALLKTGLELMDDKKSVLIEKIKNVIIDLIHYSEEIPLLKFSEYLSDKLQLDYTYLSNLFTEVQGTTIEKFLIMHKIERVKELLVYDELNLTEIAELMHYSSVAHLSAQFKKVTGLTPSHFKLLKEKRKSIPDEL
jgi:AraC-like DNA-binding protein